jgi:hypothetical protein
MSSTSPLGNGKNEHPTSESGIGNGSTAHPIGPLAESPAGGEGSATTVTNTSTWGSNPYREDGDAAAASAPTGSMHPHPHPRSPSPLNIHQNADAARRGSELWKYGTASSRWRTRSPSAARRASGRARSSLSTRRIGGAVGWGGMPRSSRASRVLLLGWCVASTPTSS